jgi:Family of unknown function (DUF6104)
MYFTDRGIEELEARRGEEDVAVAWLAERLRDFVNLNPSFETAIDRLAVFLARSDDDDLCHNWQWCFVPSRSVLRAASWRRPEAVSGRSGANRGWPEAGSGWRAGPFHPLAGPFTTSRGTYRDKSRSYSRVLVKGQGKW